MNSISNIKQGIIVDNQNFDKNLQIKLRQKLQKAVEKVVNRGRDSI